MAAVGNVPFVTVHVQKRYRSYYDMIGFAANRVIIKPENEFKFRDINYILHRPDNSWINYLFDYTFIDYICFIIYIDQLISKKK